MYKFEDIIYDVWMSKYAVPSASAGNDHVPTTCQTPTVLSIVTPVRHTGIEYAK